MRFNLTSLASVMAGGAALALAFGGAAQAGHYGPRGGSYGGAPRMAVPHTYTQSGHWAAGDGRGGLGHHWAANGVRAAVGFGAGYGLARHHYRHAGYARGGYYGGGYSTGGYYGGGGVYYGGESDYDTSYRPTAYSGATGYDYGYGYAATPSYYGATQSYERAYVVPTTVYQPTVRTSYEPVTAYRAVQHIQYVPTTQYRTVRKRCNCNWE
jgi:hypothetical protein